MSRRESRVSMNVRQNDALLEFETFKKKFLLANKHITKLNSTLSIRIEELNAQISSLYVENLRLRASEIALAAQLKKERERSQRIMADAETATHTLIKHFSSIRKNFNVPSGKPTSPVKQPPPPKARCRPALNPDASPHVNRLARAPGFPEIHEEDEDEEAGTPASPTPAARRKKPRASSSSLPPPSPPIVATIQVDVDEQLLKPSPGKKRISRRQSGLINVGAGSSTWAGGRSLSPPRPPSPAFGSPIRLEAGLAEEEEELAAMSGKVDLEDEEEELLLERAMKKERKKKAKAREEAAAESSRKRRVREEDDSSALSAAEGSKFRLKDVTNSPAARVPLPPLDTHVSDNDRQHTPDTDIPTSAMTHASTSTRPVLSTPSTTPAPSHLPTPRASSPAPPVSEPEMPAAGRSGRVRKSINYAEPKLNTKMRKPDPPGASKRASMSSLQTASRSSLDTAPPPPTQPDSSSLKRKKSRPRLPPEDASDGEQADAEFAAGTRPGWVNVDGRRRGVRGDELRRHSMAM